jgi:ribosomal protein S18 acetylase RimI-like enzyme
MTAYVSVASRPYGGDRDLSLLRDFLVTVGADPQRDGYLHLGDLLWGLYQNEVFDPTRSIRLWEREGAGLLGFAWFEEPDGVVVQARPSLRGHDGLVGQMLAWAAERLPKAEAGARELWTWAFVSDAAYIALLERQGFEREEDHALKVRRDLNGPIPTPALPPGYTLRHVGGEAEWGRRVDAHRAVWHPSGVTLDAYRRLRAAPGYIPELDLVAVAPNGDIVSYCICWLDEVNRTGEFEPVGTPAEHRGRGLGKAVMLEGLRRLRGLGAASAIVTSIMTNEASTRLYASAGFETVNTEVYYVKRW